MRCTAGLAWWRSSHILAACQLDPGQENELRVFARSRVLDAHNVAATVRLPAQGVAVDVLGDYALVLLADSTVRLYHLCHKGKTTSASDGGVTDTAVAREAESSGGDDSAVVRLVALVDLRAHLLDLRRLVSIALCAASHEGMADNVGCAEPGQYSQGTQPRPQSIVVNYSGHVSAFALELPPTRAHGGADAQDGETAPASVARVVADVVPALLAVNVEAVWAPSPLYSVASCLENALWIGCGGDGLKVRIGNMVKRKKKRVWERGRNGLPFSSFYSTCTPPNLPLLAPLSPRSGCPFPPVTETPVGLC